MSQLGLLSSVKVKRHLKRTAHGVAAVKEHSREVSRVREKGEDWIDVFGERGAKKEGEKGYRAPAYHGRSVASIAADAVAMATALMDEPELFWMFSTPPDDAEEYSQAQLPDFLAIPATGANGKPMGAELRQALALGAVSTAMAADRSRGWGVDLGIHDDLRDPVYGNVPSNIATQLLERAFEPPSSRRIDLVPLDVAEQFIAEHHSQLPKMNRRGLMYCIGLYKGERLVAVATAGTPSGPWKDPHVVLEVSRVASDGSERNSVSQLVSHLIDLLPTSSRPDARPGSRPKLVTYQLESEQGSGYRALREKGLRPVAFRKGRRESSGQRAAAGDDSLHDIDKIMWEAGPGASRGDWSLLQSDKAKQAHLFGG